MTNQIVVFGATGYTGGLVSTPSRDAGYARPAANTGVQV